jgi:hypothetical protein
MTPLEWFGGLTGVVSVLGAWLTGIAWWHGRATNRLIVETAAQTQAHASTVIERMDTHWRDAWDRADQRADERHREVIEAIKALRA